MKIRRHQSVESHSELDHRAEPGVGLRCVGGHVELAVQTPVLTHLALALGTSHLVEDRAQLRELLGRDARRGLPQGERLELGADREQLLDLMAAHPRDDRALVGDERHESVGRETLDALARGNVRDADVASDAIDRYALAWPDRSAQYLLTQPLVDEISLGAELNRLCHWGRTISDRIWLAEQLGGPLTDHHRRGRRVAARDEGHHRGVGNAEPLEPVNSQLRVDNGLGVLAHPARPDLVVVGHGRAADVVAQLLAERTSVPG